MKIFKKKESGSNSIDTQFGFELAEIARQLSNCVFIEVLFSFA